MMDHIWLTGLQAVFRSRLPSPPTLCLLHAVRHKKATKRSRQFAARDAYVVGADTPTTTVIWIAQDYSCCSSPRPP